MPKLTLEDKRRETLRRQLYGKEETFKVSKKPENTSQLKESYSLTDLSSSNPPLPSSTTYLSKDLTKVLIFSALAIGTQLSLYFLLQNNLVKLPFGN